MKTKKLVTIASTVALAACAAACSSKGDDNDTRATDSALEGAPEESAFALTLTDTPMAEGGADRDDAIDQSDPGVDDSDPTSDAAEVAPELARARVAVKELNEAVRSFMTPIAALLRNSAPTSVDGDVRVWGPVTRGLAEYRFTLRHGLLHHWGWRLDARAAGSSDDFLRVAAGGITVARAARRGTGTLGVDLDALGSVDPNVVARGLLLNGFAHGPNGTALAYRLQGFTADPTKNDPIDALVQGVHLDRGVNRAHLAYYGNLPETATDAKELVLARVRHLRGEGGRADALVTGGDVAEGRVWVASECWDASRASVFRVVRDCPADGVGGLRCDVVASSGDNSACPGLLALPELPPSDPSGAMPDADADVSAPDAMPTDDPPTDN